MQVPTLEQVTRLFNSSRYEIDPDVDILNVREKVRYSTSTLIHLQVVDNEPYIIGEDWQTIGVLVQTREQHPQLGTISSRQSDQWLDVVLKGEQTPMAMMTEDLLPIEKSVGSSLLFYAGYYKGLRGRLVQLENECCIIHFRLDSYHNRLLYPVPTYTGKGLFLACPSSYLRCSVVCDSD